MSYYFQEAAPLRGAAGGVKKGGGGWCAARSEGAQCCEADLGGLNEGVRTMPHPTAFLAPLRGAMGGYKKRLGLWRCPERSGVAASRRVAAACVA